MSHRRTVFAKSLVVGQTFYTILTGLRGAVESQHVTGPIVLLCALDNPPNASRIQRKALHPDVVVEI